MQSQSRGGGRESRARWFHSCQAPAVRDQAPPRRSPQPLCLCDAPAPGHTHLETCTQLDRYWAAQGAAVSAVSATRAWRAPHTRPGAAQWRCGPSRAAMGVWWRWRPAAAPPAPAAPRRLAPPATAPSCSSSTGARPVAAAAHSHRPGQAQQTGGWQEVLWVPGVPAALSPACALHAAVLARRTLPGSAHSGMVQPARTFTVSRGCPPFKRLLSHAAAAAWRRRA